jgi:hypothetical protein
MTTSKWYVAALTLLLSACHDPGALFMSDEDEAPTVDIKEHARPKQAYQLTMVIENAPGPFGLIEGSAQYDVTNHKTCGERNPVSGTRSRISTHPPIEWKPMGNGQYLATVYPDLMVDEDYYGNGVCRWKLMGASALLKATGTETETRFLPALDIEDILAERTVKRYFWKGGYPTEPDTASGEKGFPDLGYQDFNKFRPELHDDLFAITLSAKEVQP